MSAEIATFPRRVGANRLRSLKDVSSVQPVIGQALVFSSEGHWEPQTITPDLTDIEADIAAAQTDIVTLQADLGTAETDIATNTADIADLVSDLAVVVSDLATDIANLATHVANVSNPHVVTFAQVATYQYAAASGGLALTNTITDIPGCTLTLAAAGTYLVFSTIRLNYDAASVVIFMYLNEDGSNGTAEMYQHDSDGTAVVTFVRQVTATAGFVIKLRASENTSASSTVIQAQTSIASIKVA